MSPRRSPVPRRRHPVFDITKRTNSIMTHNKLTLANRLNAINLPVFAYGTCIGWMSPMTLLLQSPDSPTEVPLSDSLVSWMAAVAYLVCFPMDFVVAIMGDKLGRKVTLLFISASCVACWVIKLCSLSPWALILARALVGVGMAGAYVTCPLYTKEISSDAIRGALGSLFIFFHTSGNLFFYVIGDILAYRPILWIGLSIPTIHLVLFMMMPESPSFLVKNGKLEEARRVLAWLRCRDEDDMKISQELDFMQKEQAQDAESSKFVLKAILQDKLLIRAFKIAMIVALAREACGAVPVLNFAADIFSMSSEGSGLTLTPNQQAMALGAVQLAGSTLASSLVEKAGRKPLLFISSLVSGLSMAALASWFLLKDYSILAPAWIPIAMLCLCIFCDSAGLCPMAVVITTEIFSYKYRGTVIATTMATASLVDCFQLLFFKSLAKAIGVYVAFYAFGAICLMAALYIFLVIPETRNRSLTEIYNDLKTKKEKELEIKEKELEVKV